ncbi:hypothetical protein B4135_1101 [Caldibacillus debilis]|uniref:Uncharacterized protein n=1 Tax=Caldibacillus debilis TaxID=301148 RepID=A0A150MDZ3_9BACI|nr:hypothetical protein B4135_1101 [Caldibacillus debilis]
MTFSIPFAGDAHGGSALPFRLSWVTKTNRQKRGPNLLRKEGAFADEMEETSRRRRTYGGRTVPLVKAEKGLFLLMFIKFSRTSIRKLCHNKIGFIDKDSHFRPHQFAGRLERESQP